MNFSWGSGVESYCQNIAGIISWSVGLIDEFPPKDGRVIFVGNASDAVDSPHNGLDTTDIKA